jgi:hypothetical protein
MKCNKTLPLIDDMRKHHIAMFTDPFGSYLCPVQILSQKDKKRGIITDAPLYVVKVTGYCCLPTLNTLPPHDEHEPRVAAAPFFILKG